VHRLRVHRESVKRGAEVLLAEVYGAATTEHTSA